MYSWIVTMVGQLEEWVMDGLDGQMNGKTDGGSTKWWMDKQMKEWTTGWIVKLMDDWWENIAEQIDQLLY